MTKFTMYKNGIIAQRSVHKRLGTAEKASILLLSDTHGELDAIQWIFNTVQEICDCCLFSGDGVDDILTLVQRTAEPSHSAAPPVLILARGNCDREEYRITIDNEKDPCSFSIPLYQQVTIARQRILLTHGHLCRVELSSERLVHIARTSRCSIAVHGHTHVQTLETDQEAVIINSGSPMRPRGQSQGGFAIITLNNTIQTGTVLFYTLTKERSGTFSASVTASHTIPL